jgi:peptidoglycan hydrolase-like protein with peptidoglycan-binding domain
MRPPESFIGQPIRSLQTMLRTIAENDPAHERIIPDGIYGPETVSAVSATTCFSSVTGSVTGASVANTGNAITENNANIDILFISFPFVSYLFL